MIGAIVREISCSINASCCRIVHGVVEEPWGGRGAGALGATNQVAGIRSRSLMHERWIALGVDWNKAIQSAHVCGVFC
jgi:hypothetical protein